jgi:hypothetical protein
MGCDEITDDGMAHLARLVNLTSLDLRYCNQITLVRRTHLQDVDIVRRALSKAFSIV